MSELTPALRERIENTIRFLAVDAVEAATCGHPGAPMGLARPVFELWDRCLRFDPTDPAWPLRDRFVLSAGHASMLLYSLLHLFGFDLPLREIERSDRPGKSKASAGPRNQGFTFTRLTVPFSSDRTFVRIGDSLLKGPEMGATVQGVIRKRDGAIDIGGTIIPAYALNSALGEIPLFGDILTGGKGQGVFGLTFALRGTMQKPEFIVNPVSALAPGFLRRIFEIGGNYPEPGAQKKSRSPSERTN